MSTENENWLDPSSTDESSKPESTNPADNGNDYTPSSRENGDRPRRPRFSTNSANRPQQRSYGSDRPYHSRYNNDDNTGERRPHSGYQNRDYRPRYNQDGYRRPYNNEGNERPAYRPRYNQDGERPQRPYNNEGNERQAYRPRYNQEGNNERPQRSYYNRNADDGNTYRPRYNQDGNSERPQRTSYYNRNADDGNTYRPRYNQDGNSERPAYRPRYNQDGERQQRPRYNQDGNSERPAYRPRYNQDGERQQRPRYNQDGNRAGGYGNRGGYQQNRNNRRFNSGEKYQKRKPQQIEYKEQYVDPNEPIRLNKYLANAGVCSRREADEFITAGVVSVNGQVVTELGTKIKRGDEVKFHDQPVSIERKIYILLNKPKDTVTTSDDPQERRTVLDLVKGACPERIYPVGRLDRNTTGVLLLTNDGDLASKLTHPKYLKKKVYQVRLDKNLTKADMDQIATSITIDDEEIHADSIGYVDEAKKNEVGIEIHSGKNRIVRRIFESLGYRVVKLDRVLFAGLTKKGLRRGEWRFLTEAEVNYLRMGSFS